VKRLALGSPFSNPDWDWVVRSMRSIEQASHEGVETIVDNFTLSGTVTETRELDADSGDLANVRSVLATLISDIKKRGSLRGS
jgi:hypothetical protein